MSVFTALAPDRERKGPEASLGDLAATLETVAIGAFPEPPERRVDLLQRFRLHLDQRKLDLVLDVDVRALALVEHLALLAAFGPCVANPSVNVVHQCAATVLEYLRELVSGRFQSVPELVAAIEDYLQHYNEIPWRFIWRKDADTILGKIDRCQKLLNARD